MMKRFSLKRFYGGSIGFWLITLSLILVITHFLILDHFIERHYFSYYASGESVTGFFEYYKVALIIILVEIISLVLMIAYGVSLLKYFIPLRKFKESAEQLGVNINSPIKKRRLYRSKVVQDTTDAVVQMQQRIQDLINGRTKILASISHDLRTPLTRMQMRAEMLEPSERVNNILGDIAEMEIMISEILQFSQDDLRVTHEKPLDINELVMTVAQEFSEMGHQITCNTPNHQIWIMGHPIKLRRALSNILQNAMKYATAAAIDMTEVADKLCIHIQDNGPGIPSPYLEKVFEAFNRAKEESKPGVGLGLNIVQEIIKLHHGTIELSNHVEQGLQIDIQLPKMNKDHEQ